MIVPPASAHGPSSAPTSRRRRARSCLRASRSVLSASLVLPFVWGPAAWALPTSEGIALPDWLASYRVASECPSAASFVVMVAERLSVPLADTRGGASIAVEIEGAAVGASSFAGRIHVQDGTTPASSRAVAGSACAEVAAALSLIAALSLDPSEGNASRREAPGSTGSVPDPIVDDERSVEPHDEGRASSHWAVLATLPVNGATAPNLGLGGGLELGFEPARAGLWSPLAQLGAYVLASGAVSVAGDARAHFDLVAAHGLFCPVRLPSRGPWSLRPCLDLDLGKLTGRGSGPNVLEGRSRSGLWASAGAGVQLAVDVWGPIRLGVFAAALVPLARHEFYFGPDTLAFRVPALGARGAALAGVTF